MDTTAPSVVFLELNEAELYLLQKFVAAGKLPHFQRMLQAGVLLQTRMPGWDPAAEDAWYQIIPWVVWPTIYTGMLPKEHGLIAFGQDTSQIQGRCVWDVLDAAGIETGVFGSLMSFPPRSAGSAQFYVPETLANNADCFPERVRPVQEFCVYTARNYTERFARKAFTASRLLLRSLAGGVRVGTALRTLAQVPLELILGEPWVPERALLQSRVQVDAFKRLYARYRPAFATLHLNHVAYMQHRYWRALEPERYKDELSQADRRFLKTVEDRRRHERKFAHWIERSFVYSDGILGELMGLIDAQSVLVVGTGLGQRPYDPVVEMHIELVRLTHEDELFGAIGLPQIEVLPQMSSYLTANLPDEASAVKAAETLSGLYVNPGEPLFSIERRGAQLLMDLVDPRREGSGELPPIRHTALRDLRVPAARHIGGLQEKCQSTAHHQDAGFVLAWSRGRRLRLERPLASVTEIAPTVLSWFGLPAPPWMQADSPPAIQLT